MSVVRARFVAEIGTRELFSEVIGERGHYEVFVGNGTSAVMARTLETSDFAKAVKEARSWMDGLEPEQPKEPQPSGEEAGTMPQTLAPPTAEQAPEWSIEIHQLGLHVEAQGTKDEIAKKLIELGHSLLTGER